MGSVGVQTYEEVPQTDIQKLKAAIAKGPVAGTVSGYKPAFMLYRSGILDSLDCGTDLDHAITMIGYGSENGKDYWIIKNSWGAEWGEKGFGKIAIVDGLGICGIQQVNILPTAN